MDELLVSTLGKFGGAALGWIAAWYLYQDLRGLREKVMDAFLADTQMKANLLNALENLTDAVGRK